MSRNEPQIAQMSRYEPSDLSDLPKNPSSNIKWEVPGVVRYSAIAFATFVPFWSNLWYYAINQTAR
jgi:hypothetical protein